MKIPFTAILGWWGGGGEFGKGRISWNLEKERILGLFQTQEN